MRPRCLPLYSLTISLLLLAATGAPHPIDNKPPAKATIYGTVTLWWEQKVWPGQRITVYLLPVEKSMGLTRLQEESCRRTHRPGISEYEAIDIGQRYLNNAIALIPHLPSISKTETDMRGRYRFPNVPAGKAYKVVALEGYEDGEYFHIRTTTVLKSGEKLRVDLDEREPWWEVRCEPGPKGR